MRKSRDAEGSAAEAALAHQATARRACLPRPAPGMFELVVLEGPDTGKRVRVDPSSPACVLVGKSPLCGLRLGDPAVAPRQCSLQVENGRLHVVDLASGATRVNGVLAREAYLYGGELIRIGESVLCVQRTEDRSEVVRKVTSFGRLHGESDAMRQLYPTIARLLHGTDPILVEGEAGTGKRLLAEELHRHSVTDRAPFVAHEERAAAPPAVAAALFGGDGREGLVERARGGTLYVKEVGDLDADGQKKLAAMIVASAAEPVARRVRVVLASRRAVTPELTPELGALVGDSRIAMPPLRARSGDVVILARVFWTELGGKGSLPDEFASRFDGHTWPGNVRELRIAVQDRIRHGASGPDADPAKAAAHGQDAMTEVIESNMRFVEARNAVLAEFEKRYVDRALARSGRNVSRAAAASGIAHRYFQVLRSRYRSA